jgi:uncharacterized protein YbcV (DUF1398 family)
MAKSTQYINIIKEDTQLRIHSSIVQNNAIIAEELQTIILENKHNISNEAIENIKNIKSRVKNTIITIFCENVHQKVLLSHLWVNK